MGGWSYPNFFGFLYFFHIYKAPKEIAILVLGSIRGDLFDQCLSRHLFTQYFVCMSCVCVTISHGVDLLSTHTSPTYLEHSLL